MELILQQQRLVERQEMKRSVTIQAMSVEKKVRRLDAIGILGQFAIFCITGEILL